jgi:hypothetical protein
LYAPLLFRIHAKCPAHLILLDSICIFLLACLCRFWCWSVTHSNDLKKFILLPYVVYFSLSHLWTWSQYKFCSLNCWKQMLDHFINNTPS